MTATRKPRTIVSVTPYTRPDGQQRCKVEVEDGGTVVTTALAELTRPELSAAAKVLYPAIPGNVWLKFDSVTLRDLIRAGSEEAAKAAVAAKASGSGTQAQAVPNPSQEVAETVEQRLGGGKTPGDQLVELIEQLNGRIDPEEVRKLVTDEVTRQVNDLGVTHVDIRFPDGSIADLPDQHHQVLPEVIQLLSLDFNVFLVGPAGSGKSTIGEQAAKALGLDFFGVSFGPTTPTSKFLGFMDANSLYKVTPFRQAYEHGGLILLDELDNGHPGLIAELNQALANGYCSFADKLVKRHPDCRIVATGNTYGRGPDRLFVGRNILDAATLDRFWQVETLIDEKLEARLARAYSNESNEAAITRWIDYVQAVRARVYEHKLPVVVSPRATIEGAKAIAAGIDHDRVCELRLFPGLGEDVLAKIR